MAKKIVRTAGCNPAQQAQFCSVRPFPQTHSQIPAAAGLSLHYTNYEFDYTSPPPHQPPTFAPQAQAQQTYGCSAAAPAPAAEDHLRSSPQAETRRLTLLPVATQEQAAPLLPPTPVMLPATQSSQPQ